MDTPGIDVRRDTRAQGTIARVTIDHVRRLNCLGSTLMEQFVRTMDKLSQEPDLRAVVLTGAGEKAFVGGADIDEMADLDAAGARVFIERVHRCCAAVRDCPVPVIARIGGHALGAGLELAASCDLRAAATGARFGMPEVRLGIPSVVEAALLPSLIGWGRTRQLLLLGETLDAEEAQRWGLVEAIAPPEALDAVVGGWLDALLACGPRAVRLQKALIRRWEELPLPEAIAAGVETFARAYASDEPRVMLTGFRAAQRARRAEPR